jgi:hypothetical protein
MVSEESIIGEENTFLIRAIKAAVVVIGVCLSLFHL